VFESRKINLRNQKTKKKIISDQFIWSFFQNPSFIPNVGLGPHEMDIVEEDEDEEEEG
jgi:hypothetical protein